MTQGSHYWVRRSGRRHDKDAGAVTKSTEEKQTS